MNKNTKYGFLGTVNFSKPRGVISMDEIQPTPILRSFTYNEFSGATNFSATIPATTVIGDLVIYVAGCRDNRTQSTFSGTGWTDLATGLSNLFARSKIAEAGDIGATIISTWNSNTTGPAGIFVVSNVDAFYSTIQGRSSSNYSLAAPTTDPAKLLLLFNQDRAQNIITPSLTEDLRTSNIASNSYYTFQVTRSNISTPSTISVTNVSLGSVSTYFAIN
jgi:hypothetical protein